MAFDEKLAERMRTALKGRRGIDEKKMFGGLCFLSNEKMFCGIVKSDLMVRVGPENAEQALKRKGVRPMDFTGKPMAGYLYVSTDGLRGAALKRWLEMALAFVATVEKKPKRKKAAPARAKKAARKR